MLTVCAAALAVALPAPASAEQLDVTFIESFPIFDKKADFKEPSGLALSADCSHLWSVSDSAKRIVRLGLDGRILSDGAIELPVQGLEGLAFDAGGSRLLMVREDGNEVLAADIASGEVTLRRKLADMHGYRDVGAYFETSRKNKGLEGITIDPATGRVFVLKEGDPMLLIELSRDLDRIVGHKVLNAAKGFNESLARGAKLDVSGVAFDQERGLLWVVSDRGRRIFLVDPDTARAGNAPLKATVDGKEVDVHHGEGIAYCPENGRLYVVNDDGKSSRLFVYEIDG